MIIASQLREALRTRPFRAFRIRMADGRTFDVSHPELAVVTPTGRLAFVMREGEDAGSLVDLLLMRELEFLPANGGRAGKRRKR